MLIGCPGDLRHGPSFFFFLNYMYSAAGKYIHGYPVQYLRGTYLMSAHSDRVKGVALVCDTGRECSNSPNPVMGGPQ